MSDETPHNEMQSVVDYMERPYGDEDYDAWEMENGEDE